MEFGGGELAGDDPEEDDWGVDADRTGEVGRFDVGDDVGCGVDVAVADEVALGRVAMMGVLTGALMAPVPAPEPLAALVLLLAAAQPLGPSSAATAIAAISGFFTMATTPLETTGTGRP